MIFLDFVLFGDFGVVRVASQRFVSQQLTFVCLFLTKCGTCSGNKETMFFFGGGRGPCRSWGPHVWAWPTKTCITQNSTEGTKMCACLDPFGSTL